MCVTGDGDLMMSVQELATAAQYHAGVIFVVLNNSMYGTIRLHQERHFPGRVSGTGLVNPDFLLLAKSFGALGQRVVDTAGFAPALNEAINYTRERKRPALIELVCDPDLLTPEATVASLRARAA